MTQKCCCGKKGFTIKLTTEGNPNFTFGKNASVFWSCGLKFQNKFYVYGGDAGQDLRQISRIDGCSLNLVGQLGFDFRDGGCAAT